MMIRRVENGSDEAQRMNSKLIPEKNKNIRSSKVLREIVEHRVLETESTISKKNSVANSNQRFRLFFLLIRYSYKWDKEFYMKWDLQLEALMYIKKIHATSFSFCHCIIL